eukprot:GEMP01065521.1.p1 GENE.GEMP01065521.1~~GEMP01065521.1.p1  ORF type:complete len:206 (+),score=50.87 GEMP01065521.1:109-726(+)
MHDALLLETRKRILEEQESPLTIRRTERGDWGLFADAAFEEFPCVVCVDRPVVKDFSASDEFRDAVCNFPVHIQAHLLLVASLTTEDRELSRGLHKCEWVPHMADTTPANDLMNKLGDLCGAEDFSTLCGAMRRNTFQKDAAPSAVPWLFWLISVVNHSDESNCTVEMIGDVGALVTRRQILEGEEITISYSEDPDDLREVWGIR